MTLSDDDDVNALLDETAQRLASLFGHSSQDAEALVAKYYNLFTSREHCLQLGIPVQDDDFFFHEGEFTLAQRIQYYLVLIENPDPSLFKSWSLEFSRSFFGNR